jgi:ATP-binding cassette subfamily B multidrug efflux pump
MSADAPATEDKGQLKETERVQAGPGPGRGPFGGGMVGQKASDFKPSAKRLIRRMRPERLKVLAVLVVTVASVVLTAIGPRILGKATDLIFAGLLGARLPAGVTKEQAVSALRDRGEDKQADLVASINHLVPGQGVDFGAVGHVLMIVLAVYVASAALAWLAGYLLNDVVQAIVLRMRSDVEDKVHRLPLSYFDKQPRGELLSRVTNDIDNLSQSLQQTMSQLLTSVLTVFAVLAMMLWISPLLALVALVSVPLSMFVTGRVR